MIIQTLNVGFRFGIIPSLADILNESVKEKVTRIILAVFRVRMSFYASHIDSECIY